MADTGPLLRTPLYERHVALGARMVPFGGWEMPVQYSGIIDEHTAVRTAAGLFDISHMGEVEVRGPDALPFLQHVLTQNIAAIAPGQSNYALLCRPDGGVVDDAFVYNLETRYLVVINASNIAKDLAWLGENAASFDMQLHDASPDTAMLAVQGPAAETIVRQATGAALATLPFHGVGTGTAFGLPAVVARTGYTGEDGFELFVAREHAEGLWQGLMAIGQGAGLKPCGLGARDSLRFEACLALYGHELDEQTNPYEARLGWVVKLDKAPFVGSEALRRIQQDGVARKLVGFEMVGRGVARGDYPIHSVEGEPIGRVTSGMPSPSLGKNLGMGYVPAALATEGAEFDVLVREKPVRARVIKMPFYKPRYKK
jgi:aminomethyltransferase